MAAGTSSANCPTVAITDHVADAAALEQVFDDPNCFSFPGAVSRRFHPEFRWQKPRTCHSSAASAASLRPASSGT